jgi:hypothetical protein
VQTDVSEEHIAFIIKVEKYAEQGTSVKAEKLATCFNSGFLLNLFFRS